MKPYEFKKEGKPTSWLTKLLEPYDSKSKQTILKMAMYQAKLERLDKLLDIRKLQLEKRWQEMLKVKFDD